MDFNKGSTLHHNSTDFLLHPLSKLRFYSYVVLTFIMLVSTASKSLSQSIFPVRGKVIDNVQARFVSDAAVTILHQKDSILVAFQWTPSNGVFQFDLQNTGKYTLLVSYPGYADFIESFEVTLDSPPKDFGNIYLISKEHLIDEVTIKGNRSSIQVIGDTLQYSSEFFKNEINAKVEDMLRQIPGIQIDRNGKITAYGKQVNTVLIDGEEFFGTDPTLVTRNIRADMVDKIQIFDKKSDFTAKTGINDGLTKKTVNIKLKEDMKKGIFGKLSGATGSNGYNRWQGMANVFSNSTKFAAFLNNDNTGSIGLLATDMGKYGFSSGNFDFFRGGILASMPDAVREEFERGNDSHGLPKSTRAGSHIQHKWNEEKSFVTADYSFSSLGQNGNLQLFSRSPVGSGVWENSSRRDFNSQVVGHNLDAKYRLKPNSKTEFEFSLGALRKFNDNTYSIGSATHSNLTHVLHLQNNLASRSQIGTIVLNAAYNGKLHKAGRSYFLTANYFTNLNSGTRILTSISEFLSMGKIDSTQNSDQYKQVDVNLNLLSATAGYTEPILKHTNLVVNYGVGINQTNSKRNTWSRSADSTYSVPVPNLSSDANLKEVSNKLNAELVFNPKNWYVSLGAGLNAFSLNYEDMVYRTTFVRKYVNLNPTVFLSRNIQRGWLKFTYLNLTIQPSLDQIYPVSANDDPANVQLGNPGIGPASANRFRLDYVKSKPLKGTSVDVSGNFTATSNAIINAYRISPSGTTTYQALNLQFHSVVDFDLKANYSRKIGKSTLSAGIQYSQNNQFGIVNGDLIKNTDRISGVSVHAWTSSVGKYYVDLRLQPGYTSMSSSNSSQLNNSGFNFNGNAQVGLYFPAGFMLSSSGYYTYRAKTMAFPTPFHQFLVQASLSKVFMQKKNLRFAIIGNDLLNQNTGFTRNIMGNFLTERKYTTIKRHVLFSLTWDFSKFGKTTEK